MKKRLIVCGANGKMGSKICELALSSGSWETVVQSTRQRPLKDLIGSGEVLIDFTLPEAASLHLTLAQQNKKPLVIGTTGLSTQQHKQMEAAAKTIPIVYSPNMSIGINVLFRLIETASKTLGETFQVEISETHHIHKKDSPSGTARAMGLIVEKMTGKKPPIDSIREGEVVGEHSIVFGSEFEHLALFHRALDRKVFAAGALRAAEWILDKKPGLYSMQEVLGI